MNVINIGANIGYFTLLAAREVGPDGKVFAFEPFPQTVELLKKNIDVNGYPNVEVIPMAVSSKSGIAKLSTGGSSLHNIISSTKIKEMTEIEVPQISIDDFVSQKQIKIDFMIIDAEGSEPFILDGMKNTLKNNPNLVMMIEFNPYTLNLAGSSTTEFLKIISNNEYLMYLIDEITQKITPITSQQLEHDIKPPQVANLLLSKTQLMDI
jgi:FkbM family methyltransferase